MIPIIKAINIDINKVRENTKHTFKKEQEGIKASIRKEAKNKKNHFVFSLAIFLFCLVFIVIISIIIQVSIVLSLLMIFTIPFMISFISYNMLNSDSLYTSEQLDELRKLSFANYDKSFFDNLERRYYFPKSFDAYNYLLFCEDFSRNNEEYDIVSISCPIEDYIKYAYIKEKNTDNIEIVESVCPVRIITKKVENQENIVWDVADRSVLVGKNKDIVGNDVPPAFS